MNMNGGTSTSATDPLNQHRNTAYLGMGPPGPMGGSHLPPVAGNGYGTGLGISGAAAIGPELKHHADFLSRLLAATPSYMNEVGNPPPGFFSDWLRRLVSKPAGGNGSTGLRRESPSTNLSTSSSTKSIQHQTSSMTFSSSIGQAESNGGPNPLETSTPTGKRRKRTRISDHLPHHSVKESNSVNESTSPSPSNMLHGSSGLASSSTSPPNSSSTSTSQLNMNPFSHPLWFFPPFLPNPYLSPLSMGMGISGLLPPPGVPPPPNSANPYLTNSLSGLPNPEHLLSSFRQSDNLLHGHSYSNSGEMNHISPPIPKKESNESTKASPKRNNNKSTKKSTGFSISRLTSPSPSSNSSGGSGVGHKHASNNNNYNHHSNVIDSCSKSASAIENSKKLHGSKVKEKRISDSGSETGSGTGVDLRVAGRGYVERSSANATAPQSIYKPLSAFRDPADVNLTHSSSRTRDSFGLRESPNSTISTKKTTSTVNKEARKMILRDQSNLSTTYVLKNLQNIYQRIKEESTRATDSFPTINTTFQNNSSHSSIADRTSSNAHSFNYSEIQNLRHEETNNEKEEIEDSEHNRDNELAERSPSPEIITNNGPIRIKIPLPRPVKTESNFSSNNSPGFKRSYDQISPNSVSPPLSPSEDSEKLNEQLSSPKAAKYEHPDKYKSNVTTGEDSESDDLNVLSDDPEEVDDAEDKISKPEKD